MLGVGGGAQDEEDDAIVSVDTKNKAERKYSNFEDDDAIVATNDNDDAIVSTTTSKKLSKEDKAILEAAQTKPLWQDDSRNVYNK